MKKTRSHLAVLIALLLLAGPWLQFAEPTAASNEIVCGLPQAPIQDCCCTGDGAMETENSDDPGMDCSCDISDSPAVPDLPPATHEHRSDDQRLKARPVLSLSTNVVSIPGNQLPANGNSPPSTSSPPAYLMYGALLI